MMKKCMMLLLIMVAPVVCFAQSTLHYTYNDAGNRTSRTIIISPRQQPRLSSGLNTNMYEDGKITITSNKTNMLHVEILGLKGIAHVSVYDSSGKQYVSIDMNSSTTNIDTSIVPVGIYVLKIEANNEVNTWKLIKN